MGGGGGELTDFMTLLALCHTVIPERPNDTDEVSDGLFFPNNYSFTESLSYRPLCLPKVSLTARFAHRPLRLPNVSLTEIFYCVPTESITDRPSVRAVRRNNLSKQPTVWLTELLSYRPLRLPNVQLTERMKRSPTASLHRNILSRTDRIDYRPCVRSCCPKPPQPYDFTEALAYRTSLSHSYRLAYRTHRLPNKLIADRTRLLPNKYIADRTNGSLTERIAHRPPRFIYRNNLSRTDRIDFRPTVCQIVLSETISQPYDLPKLPLT